MISEERKNLINKTTEFVVIWHRHPGDWNVWIFDTAKVFLSLDKEERDYYFQNMRIVESKENGNVLSPEAAYISIALVNQVVKKLSKQHGIDSSSQIGSGIQVNRLIPLEAE